MTFTVSPAYGRDYKSAKAARADWDADKDFTIEEFSSPWCGKPINKAQAEAEGLVVYIRYNSLRSVCPARGD